MGRVKLRCGDSAPLSEGNSHVHHVLVDKVSRQVLGHEISGIGCPAHLHELNDLSEVLLLQPESSDIQVPDPPNATPLEDAQGGTCIHMETCPQLDPEIGCE
jgi:hypothetical protein